MYVHALVPPLQSRLLNTLTDEVLVRIVQSNSALIDQMVKENADCTRILNSRTLISRLPNEILVHIFLECTIRRQERKPFHNRAERIFAKLWLNFTHVCRRWRDVALSCPLLWNYVHLGLYPSPDIMSHFLSRSRNVPLDVRFSLLKKPVNQHKDLAKAAVGECHRTRTLELEVYELTSEAMSCFREASFPNLRRLRFTSQWRDKGYYDEDDQAWPEDEDFMQTLLQQPLPHLRTLQIDSIVSLAILKNLPHTITSLSVLSSIIIQGELKDFLGVLSSMPQLEYLELFHIPTLSRPERPLPKTLILPNLKRLIYTDAYWNARLVFPYLSQPSLVELRATFDWHPNEHTNVHRVIPLFHPFQPDSVADRKNTFAAIDLTIAENLSFTGCRKLCTHTHGHHDFNISFKGDPDVWGYYLARVLPQLELPILSLTYRHSSDNDHGDLLSHLLEVVDDNIPFPHLRELDVTIDHADNCDAVLKCIKTRHTAGSRLDKLRVHLSASISYLDGDGILYEISTLKRLVKSLQIIELGRVIGWYKEFGRHGGSSSRLQRLGIGL